MVQPGVVQFQGQGVLPVDAAGDGLGGLTVGEALDILKNGDPSQASGRGGRLAAGGEQLGELVVAVEVTQLVGDAEAEGAFGEGGVGDAVSLLGDRKRRLGRSDMGFSCPRAVRCGGR